MSTNDEGTGVAGALVTVRLADAVPPAPPSFELTAPVVLFLVPALVLCTLTVTVQEALAARVPAVKLTEPDPAVAVAVPPQELLRPLGVATTRPAGRVSVNATPVRPVPAFGFVMVKVSEVVPFRAMLDPPNALVMVGGLAAATVTVAVEVFPVPPSFEFTVTLLFFTPAVVPWTLSETVHEALAASVPAVRLTEPDPAVAVVVPPQVLVRPLGVATTRPAGRVSVNATPVRPVPAFGFVMVKVSEVVPFRAMLDPPNALVMVGGLAATVRLALAVFPVPPSVEFTVTLLFLTPRVVPCTFSETVQEAPGARLPLLRLTVPDPAVAVVVPAHVLVRPLGVATTIPAGKVSVKETPVRLAPALGLFTVKVSEVVAFGGMLAAPNDLVMVGGPVTVTAEVAGIPVPPSTDVGVTLLTCTPGLIPVTFSMIVHESVRAKVAPARLTEAEPATAVVVPVHVLLRLLGVDTTKPAGKVSVNATPVRLFPVFGLVTVRVSEVVPFSERVDTPNAFVMTGGLCAAAAPAAKTSTPKAFIAFLAVKLSFM
jgi:hypothetical protein